MATRLWLWQQPLLGSLWPQHGSMMIQKKALLEWQSSIQLATEATVCRGKLKKQCDCRGLQIYKKKWTCYTVVTSNPFLCDFFEPMHQYIDGHLNHENNNTKQNQKK